MPNSTATRKDRNKKYDAPLIERILALYNQGLTVHAISRTLECSNTGIGRWLRRHGYNTSTERFGLSRINDPAFHAQILALYDQQLSIQEIARRMNHAYPAIYLWLKAQGKDTSLARIPANRKSIIRSGSYKFLYEPTHPNADENGYVREHVAIVSKALGRALKDDEVVHHINGNKLDNRNQNLLVCSRSYHQWLHRRMGELYQQEHFA